MSEDLRVLLVGATGLIGRHVMDASVGRGDFRLLALSRREVPLPKGARMEVLIADPAEWDQAIAAIAPDLVICALGTTIAKMDGDKAAFAAVDHDLVVKLAEQSKAAGATRFTVISSVGAEGTSKNFYLATKGKMEEDLAWIGFKRLDILRPGLLRGARSEDKRGLEQLGIFAAPLMDIFLHGDRRKYRSARAEVVAAAALQTIHEKAAGKFIHQHDDILRLDGRFRRS